MSCPTVTALVMSGGCAHCDQHGCCEIEALVLRQVNSQLKLATFAQMAAIYKSRARASELRKECVILAITKGLAMLGLSAEMATFADLKDGTRIDEIVEMMRKSNYADETIHSYVSIFRSFDGNKMRRWLREAGYDVSGKIEFDISKYEFKRAKFQKVGFREVSKIRRRMAILAESDNHQDRATFLFLFLYLECSMSKRDIVDAKWSLFKRGLDGTYFGYTRHKTGHDAGDILSPDAWLLIEEMVGDENDYIVPNGTRGRHTRTLETVSRRANKICRECGILGTKGCHALRKHGAQIARAFGNIHSAASRLGDTIAVTNRNYAGETSRLGLMGIA